MNWGKGIIVAFVLFAGVIGTMVIIAMKQDVSLVSADYYKQEIDYQSQIERHNNYNELSIKPSIKKEKGRSLVLEYPAPLLKSFISGEVLFFRPSDANLDRKYKIQLDEKGKQKFDLEGMMKGMWKVRISWKDKVNDEYFSETILNI